ncbi:type I restriction endonuclease subunit R [Aliarcobacter butzleri]|uniref:type I restriction endonuclease subunit R n=1 Tax=Aliarcobacter butzleri TaxID=28197 RepID=UPI00125ED33D|nr:type I restriction endonuclease subunit R [Aliarcobacter butzleri]
METEKETREKQIDKKLLLSDWDTSNNTKVVKEFYLKTSNEKVDYVLFAKDGKPLAVVEAKKSSKDAELGREQAKQYCQNIKDELSVELPFCFYTNGNDIYFWDIGNYPPRKIYSYPTIEDLERLRHIKKYKKSLSHEFIDTNIAGRDYQVSAIRSVMEAIDKKRRDFLLVMATGTGKTRTTIALIDSLMRAGIVKNTLFLVDRIALREQAIEAFKEYMPNEPYWPKFGESTISKDRRLYISTYPTMLNVIRDDEQALSSHFFDLIIIDESHRSIYNTYGEILDYFDAIKLGLTATPTSVIDHNTFNLFDCEDGLPTFAFSYEEALDHTPPYLCDFQVMKIKTKFQDEGLSKRTISLEDQKRLILEGKDIEEVNFEGTDLEKSVINIDTNRLIVKAYMEECIKDDNGVLPSKTIFFCMTKAHARRVEELFDELYPEHVGELAKVIVSDDSRAYGKGGLLDQFKNQDMPRVAISVGMLDTGVDIKEVTNLVFAKPIYSYTRFWQMIGRGTRLLDPSNLKPWCTKKDKFLILDCWDNFEYFKLQPQGKDLTSNTPLPVTLFDLRAQKIATAIETNPDIATKEIAKLQEFITSFPANSITIKDAQNDLDKLDSNFWQDMTKEKISFLDAFIKPLAKSIVGVDYKAMRFEKDVLAYSTYLLQNDKEKLEKQRDKLISQISELPLSINIVATQKELITKAKEVKYWNHVSDSELDSLVANLAPLMKYREELSPKQQAKYDFEDIIKEKEYVEFGADRESVSITKYKEMVENKIAELLDKNPILQKLKSGQNIAHEEIEILAQTLHDEDPYITIDLLRRVYMNKKAPFLKFIKHILGVEELKNFPDTVSESFDKFIQIHPTLTTTQLKFLELLKNYIIDNGDITKKDLIQAPFTVIHPSGIRGVFTPIEIEEILQITQELVA